MKYEIHKPNEDPKKIVIRKTGHVIDFSLGEVEENDRLNRNNLKEIVAMRDLQKAKMTNIEQHHPFLADLSEEERFTVHMYQEAKALFKGFDKKAKEIQRQVDSDEAEVAEIKKQIPEVALVKSEMQPDEHGKV